MLSICARCARCAGCSGGVSCCRPGVKRMLCGEISCGDMRNVFAACPDKVHRTETGEWGNLVNVIGRAAPSGFRSLALAALGFTARRAAGFAITVLVGCGITIIGTGRVFARALSLAAAKFIFVVGVGMRGGSARRPAVSALGARGKKRRDLCGATRCATCPGFGGLPFSPFFGREIQSAETPAGIDFAGMHAGACVVRGHRRRFGLQDPAGWPAFSPFLCGATIRFLPCRVIISWLSDTAGACFRNRRCSPRCRLAPAMCPAFFHIPKLRRKARRSVGGGGAATATARRGLNRLAGN